MPSKRLAGTTDVPLALWLSRRRTVTSLATRERLCQDGPMSPPESRERYVEPGWFTTHVLNRVVQGLTLAGISVWG